MKYIKTFEDNNEKLKKYIEFKILNLITILQVINETPNIITVQKLFTYETINKRLSITNEPETTLLYDNFTKECIGKQSDKLNDLIAPLRLDQETNKYNL